MGSILAYGRLFDMVSNFDSLRGVQGFKSLYNSCISIVKWKLVLYPFKWVENVRIYYGLTKI